MAYYYCSADSGSDYGEYNLNSYAVNYDYAQFPALRAYNNYEDSQPCYGYDPSLYFVPNYYPQSYQTTSHSATTYSGSKSVEYDPNYGMTRAQLVISYNTLEFNEPEFDEYDPTPYGGGYDIAETYGKPLSPSDKICYPKSGPSSISTPFDPVPYVDEKAVQPQNGTADQVTGQSHSQDDSIDRPREDEDNTGEGEDESDESGEYVYEPAQYPSGYGLEAMDLCEGLFGYWPCLSRMRKRELCCEEVSGRGSDWRQGQDNMWKWKGTADYLFGNPYPYPYPYGERCEGDLVSACQSHYPTHPHPSQTD